MAVTWESIGYAIACVVVPVLWGVAVVRLSNAIERRVSARRMRREGGGAEPPPIEYHI
jgi:hypothetical protein